MKECHRETLVFVTVVKAAQQAEETIPLKTALITFKQKSRTKHFTRNTANFVQNMPMGFIRMDFVGA